MYIILGDNNVEFWIMLTELSQAGIMPDKDIKMSGKVTWAGKTSMEITMELDQVCMLYNQTCIKGHLE